MALGRLVVVQLVGDAQGDAGRGDEVAGRLIDLDDQTWTHEELAGQRLEFAAVAGPAVKRQAVRFAVTPCRGQQNLLMMAVAGGIGLPIDVGQRFGVAEIARFAQGQVERDRCVLRPVGGHGEAGTQHKICTPCAPIGVGFDTLPVAVVDVGVDQRFLFGIRQRLVAKRLQRRGAPMHERFDQLESLGNFQGGPTHCVQHKQSLLLVNVEQKSVAQSAMEFCSFLRGALCNT